MWQFLNLWLCAIIVSIISIDFSRHANHRSLKLQEEQIKMQERVTQIEELRERDRVIQSQKAHLKAKLSKNERNSYRLIVENTGKEYAPFPLT
jgi:hypothetical protein